MITHPRLWGRDRCLRGGEMGLWSTTAPFPLFLKTEFTMCDSVISFYWSSVVGNIVQDCQVFIDSSYTPTSKSVGLYFNPCLSISLIRPACPSCVLLMCSVHFFYTSWCRITRFSWLTPLDYDALPAQNLVMMLYFVLWSLVKSMSRPSWRDCTLLIW